MKVNQLENNDCLQHLVKDNMTDEEYQSIYGSVYQTAWDKDLLEKAKDFLAKWDENEKYVKSCSITSQKINLAEKIHYKNVVNYWEKKLNES